MHKPPALLLGFPCALLLTALAGCGEHDSTPAASGVRQTHFPGEVTAGGGTSGEVLARNGGATGAKNAGGTPGTPQGKGETTGGAETKGSGEEAMRGQAATPGGSVSGTPSIPEGAGGNPSGAAMGGTTPGAAGSKAAPEPQPTPAAPAQKEKQ